jgi:putative ABC transport system ATP-binding protein
MLPHYPLGNRHGEAKKRALSLLGLLNLGSRASARMEWLSGGEMQRVGIARALMNGPSVIIADEPTAHLDSRLSLEFMEIISRLKGQGKTIIIASHDPIVFDGEMVDRVVTIRDGRVVGDEA